MNKLLVDHAKKVQTLGFQPVPIVEGSEKKPLFLVSLDTHLREGKRPVLTHQEIESIFSNPEVRRVGIMLDKRCFLIRALPRGSRENDVRWSEMIPQSCSKETDSHF